MGKDWDRLWLSGASQTKPGIGDRAITWPAFNVNTPHGGANPTCDVCGGRLRGAKQCSCEQPHDHWKPLGPPRGSASRPETTESATDRAGRGENHGIHAGKPAFDLTIRHHGMQAWHEAWLRLVFRALVPGGLVKAFGGTRTFHRLGAAMEHAGFEIVGLEAWAYGSGFPKSLDVSKAIDAAAGATREVVGMKSDPRYMSPRTNSPAHMDRERGTDGGHGQGHPAAQVTAPATPEAAAWSGWGTALKPAWEPFLIGRKPETP